MSPVFFLEAHGFFEGRQIVGIGYGFHTGSNQSIGFRIDFYFGSVRHLLDKDNEVHLGLPFPEL